MWRTIAMLPAACLLAGIVLAQMPAAQDASVDSAVEKLRAGHAREAQALAESMVRADPQSAIVHAVYGLSLLDCGAFRKAQAEFERAIELDAECPEAHIGLGELDCGRRRFDEGLAHLQRGRRSATLKLRSGLSLSRCLDSLNRRGEARVVLRQTLEQAEQIPDYIRTRIQDQLTLFEAYGDAPLFRVDESFETTSVPFRNWRGHVLVEATLNGTETVELHLDIGNTGTVVISDSLAKKLALDIVGEHRGRNIASEHTAQVAVLDSFGLGSMTMHAVPVSILPAAEFVGGAAGNLGNAVLQRLNISIDYPNSRVHLFGFDRTDVQRQFVAAAASADEVPFWGSNLLLVEAMINGLEPAPLVLDSGAGAVVLDRAYFDEKLQATEAPGDDAEASKAQPFVIKTFRIGEAEFTNIFSVVMDLSALYEYARVYYPGILGNNVFQQSRLHLNFKDSLLIVDSGED